MRDEEISGFTAWKCFDCCLAAQMDVVPAAARWPQGRAKHVCNLAAAGTTRQAGSAAYLRQARSCCLSRHASWQARLHQVAWRPGRLNMWLPAHTSVSWQRWSHQLSELSVRVIHPESVADESQYSVGIEPFVGISESCARQSMWLLWHHGKWSPRLNDLPFGRSMSDSWWLTLVWWLLMLCSAKSHVIRLNVITSIIRWQ